MGSIMNFIALLRRFVEGMIIQMCFDEGRDRDDVA
jgi:hypothetical protein